MKTSRLSMAGLAIAVALLSGCAASTPADNAGADYLAPASSAAAAPAPVTSSPVTSESAPAVTGATAGSPSATPAPSSDAPVITTTGYGDLTVGDPVPASTELVDWDPGFCGPAGEKFSGHWVPRAGEDDFSVFTANNGQDADIAVLTFWSPDYLTKSGAHAGTTVDDLRTLFPDARVRNFGSVEVYVVSDELGKVVFEVPTEDIGIGSAGVVLFIHVLPADTDAYSIAQGDTGRTCPA